VERPIRYLRENFFYGRQFTNDADLDAQLSGWLTDVANVRIHGTTGEKPLERFLRDEKAVLAPLPLRSYQRIGALPTKENRAHVMPFVEVERRPLDVYRQLAGGDA
jgi:hypothetical protein